MTKLAPIEELIETWNSLPDELRFDARLQKLANVIRDIPNDATLRQAIIRDFVSTLEPVHSQFFDVNSWYDYLNEKHKKNTVEAGYFHRDLYDLSEWIEK